MKHTVQYVSLVSQNNSQILFILQLSHTKEEGEEEEECSTPTHLFMYVCHPTKEEITCYIHYLKSRALPHVIPEKNSNEEGI